MSDIGILNRALFAEQISFRERLLVLPIGDRNQIAPRDEGSRRQKNAKSEVDGEESNTVLAVIDVVEDG